MALLETRIVGVVLEQMQAEFEGPVPPLVDVGHRASHQRSGRGSSHVHREPVGDVRVELSEKNGGSQRGQGSS